MTTTSQQQESVGISSANVEPIMDEALNFLETNIKKEYMEALEVVPALVATETCKSKFLRVEQNNPWNAARRLAMYWKFRKELNGEERWLRPMTATGTGVLGDREVELLRRGIYHYTNSPEYGPVLVVDGSRNKGASIEECDRVVFYLSTIIDDEDIQTRGATIVYAVTGEDTESNISDRLGVYVALGLPVRIRRFVVVQNWEPGKESLLEYLAVRRKLQVDVNFRGHCELIASSQSRGDLLSSAHQAGIPWQALPKTCGGRFGNDVLCDWLRQRMSVEDCMLLNSTASIRVIPVQALTQSSNRHSQVVKCRGVKRRAIDSSAPKPEKLGHAAHEELQRQCKRLRLNNKALQADNRRLEELLLQARKVSLEHQMAAMLPNTTEDGLLGPVSAEPPTQPVSQVPLPQVATCMEPTNDYLFGVPVADPFESMCDNELAHFIHLRRR